MSPTLSSSKAQLADFRRGLWDFVRSAKDDSALYALCEAGDQPSYPHLCSAKADILRAAGDWAYNQLRLQEEPDTDAAYERFLENQMEDCPDYAR